MWKGPPSLLLELGGVSLRPASVELPVARPFHSHKFCAHLHPPVCPFVCLSCLPLCVSLTCSRFVDWLLRLAAERCQVLARPSIPQTHILHSPFPSSLPFCVFHLSASSCFPLALLSAHRCPSRPLVCPFSCPSRPPIHPFACPSHAAVLWTTCCAWQLRGSSFVDYLLRLAAERYQVLAQWPDFSTAYGKDFYYRAHPEDLKKFYAAVDEFHAAYDTLTEFESLSGVAAQMLPGYQKRRQNVMGPTVGPTSANAAVTQFLLAHAK
ncbi:hypothetical protein DUNSADRAFT_11646 [Dunaliella salina]|uniref:Uncharacterized protein n=1 Tax=Dunaliella salina TaxID=3046 RepID=A0ABQ7GCV0_DUNSA|nr:hypothetical protein DUNSADRAFT_11646 [Dunaliella salina]|eukprot:KAF5832446.1 hypothetical protein DUNSADRAFT_11646 [Dunaliella salina]